MKNKYLDLIQQTFYFPQDEFSIEGEELIYDGMKLMDLVEEYGSPLKISYLPKISSQIRRAKKWFGDAMQKHDYKGSYTYCYCTKSSHFHFVLEEVLKNDSHLETSSAFDIDLVRSLYEEGRISKKTFILSNGHKPLTYVQKIAGMINEGFNIVPILDCEKELKDLSGNTKKPFKIGVRIATEEKPSFEFYTSRLGIGYKRIKNFYQHQIKDNKQVELKMLHFFINSGISDTAYYWTELLKCLNVYYELSKVCPTLDSLNIGGGLPFKNSLGFEYDYEYIIDEIIGQIKEFCAQKKIKEPNIFTEFGSFTTGESGINIYAVNTVKEQNDAERWYMIDNSFMTTLPDAWSINQRYILLPINHWKRPYQRVNLGGLSCDSFDYYNSEAHVRQIFLPKIEEGEKLYIAMFNTGAYQEALSGYGGIKHCLIPFPKHVTISKDQNEKLDIKVFREEQKASEMLSILGY